MTGVTDTDAGRVAPSWDGAFEGLLRPLLPLLPPDAALTAHLDLVAAGLDSLNVVELLALVEDHYGITLSDDEIAQQTVSSPQTLWRVISRHLPSQASDDPPSPRGEPPRPDGC